MKLLVSVGFIACLAAGAHASFDLMMVPDENSKGVARFDPVSRISLGAFAQNDGGRTVHSVNRAVTSSHVFASTGSGSAFYDYNSGDVSGSSSVPGGLTLGNAGGTRFVESFITTLYSYNQAGAYQGFTSTGLSTLYVGAPLSTSALLAFGADSSNNFCAYLKNGALSVTTVITSSASTMLVGTPYVAVDSATTSIVYLPLRTSAGQSALYRYSINMSTGAMTILDAVAFGGFSSAACMTVLPGHNSVYLIGRDSTTSSLTRITSVGLSPLVQNYSYTTSSIQVPTSRWVGAMVLAPEPSSYAAFLVGGFALLRRRRR